MHPVALRLVVSQNKKELLVNWFNEGKLEPGEELGDIINAAGEAREEQQQQQQLCWA